MDILIGKHGNQPFKLTEPSISREHALFHKDEVTGRMTLRDKNSTNGTWIMANDGRFKRLVGEAPVGPNTIVRLGAKHTFMIKELLAGGDGPGGYDAGGKKSVAVDISNLRAVYEKYQQDKMSLEAKTSNIMMWRMTSLSLGSIFAILLTMLVPKDFAGDTTVSSIIKIAGSVVAIGLSWLIVDIKNKNLIRRKDENERNFRKKYCCPKCGYHFGTKLYENILAEGKCPNSNCRCKFTGK